MESGQKMAETEQEQNCNNAAQTPFMAKHSHVLLAAPPPTSDDHEGPEARKENVEVGSIYEIDHIYLPPRTPVQLKSIRVVMVCEKTELNVAVRFPSTASLRAFFGYSTRETHPALDEKFVMGIGLAAKVLTRQLCDEEFYEQKHSEAFWLINSSNVDSFRSHAGTTQNKGSCLSELKCNGMVRWGIRRQVKYLGRHRETISNDNLNAQNSSTSFVPALQDAQVEDVTKTDSGNGYGQNLGENTEKEMEEEEGEEEEEEAEEQGEEEENGDEDVSLEDVNVDCEITVKQEEENDEVDDEEEEENEDDQEEAEEENIHETKNKNLKRKRYSFRNRSVKQAKKVKVEKKKKQKQQKNMPKSTGRRKCKESLILRNPKERWSTERYKLAEKNLLEVMKAKGATASKPILRPQLRAEARKRIGDTGLLDHLLKHMAGRIAPGGVERFRRRHNADGAMEYWLESADLVNIRKDAGVTDPYWIPPPGWKPGDSPTQDPICAQELKLLKDEISQMKRDMELMRSTSRLQLEEEIRKLRREMEKLIGSAKLQIEEEIGKLRREIVEISSKKMQDEIPATAVSSCLTAISQNLDKLTTPLMALKSGPDGSPPTLEKCKDQLTFLNDHVKELEDKNGKLMPNGKEKTRSESALNVPTESIAEKEKKQMVTEEIIKDQGVKAVTMIQEETSELTMIQEETSELNNNEQKKAQNAATPKAVEAEKKASSSSPAAEQKAAKIQRLKSGFRICKPQGTFLWPNMVRNNNMSPNCNMLSPHQVVVQVEVPTPPSVSSSTASAPPQLPYHQPSGQYLHRHQPPSPVKPLAERRAVKVTVSTVPNGPQYEVSENNHSFTTNMINLNNAPSNPTPLPPMLPNPVKNEIVMPTTYENAATYWARNLMGYTQMQQNISSSSSSVSSLPSEVGNWLALSTPQKSAPNESFHG